VNASNSITPSKGERLADNQLQKQHLIHARLASGCIEAHRMCVNMHSAASVE